MKLMWIGAALVLAAPGIAQEASPEAKDVQMKTLAAYSGAKSYQGSWIFLMERGAASQRMSMEIKSKSPAMLYFHVGAASKEKLPKGAVPIPELMVLLDGKTAYFVNSTSNVYYKVPLPKNAQVSPLMFFPQIPASGAVSLTTTADKLNILEASTSDGGKSRMEVTPDYHIKRIVAENTVGLIRVVSIISMEKETFDGEIPDKEFTFKVPHGAKEIPAPAGAGGIFGPAT